MLNKIKLFLKDAREFEDDRDDKYVYKKTVNPVLAIFISLFSGARVKKDRRQQTFGRIKGNIFYYITFPMIFVFGAVTWAVIAAFANLLPYYETNIFLNGLIISFMIYGILKTFFNSYLLYKTARFFRLMESIIRKDDIPQEDIYKLRRSMERDGYLINTINMVETIDDIEKFGHPNFNDHRARMIKSKLGARVSKGKGNVSYIAGILVMLGLLGTFLGLLATIDAVGNALGGMAGIGQGDGGVGTEDMSLFISSLAKPLDGMGLAFSSSLFGLSGSLLIGFFLYLSGTPQNDFIENISRWIDNRIPVHNPQFTDMVQDSEEQSEKEEGSDEGENKEKSQKEIDEKKLSKINPPVKDQDLKDWLSGYIYMSVKMNNIVKNLCDEVSETTMEIQKVTQDNQVMQKTQNNLVEGMASTNALLHNIEGHNQNISQVIPTIISSGQSLADKVEDMRLAQANSEKALSEMQGYLQQVPSFINENQGISKLLQGNAGLVTDLIAKSDAQSQASVQVNNQILSVLDVIKSISENSNKIENESIDLNKHAVALNQEVLGLNKEALNINQNALSLYQESSRQDQANKQHMSEGLKNMQGALMQISGQIDGVNNKINAEETLGDIKSIKGFVADLNGLQKELVDSIKAFAKDVSDSKYGKINETLIERIERKISNLEEKLKSFLSK